MWMEKYILDGRRAVLCDAPRAWAKWYVQVDRTVAKTVIQRVGVSTDFLGVDHRIGEGPPILFGTMVFGGKHDGETDCYSTWEEAEAGHRKMCRKVFPSAHCTKCDGEGRVADSGEGLMSDD